MKKRTGGKPSGAKHGKHQYVPDAGHLVWFSFSPQAGREQAGRRPALVLSPRSYNAPAGLCVICPITSQVKEYPFEVPLPDGLPVAGVVLSDHLRSADWRARSAEYAGNAPAQVLSEVRAKLKPLLGT
ncbi:MAG: endoribonuclease MazF [Isosphaeraceae bacterium]